MQCLVTGIKRSVALLCCRYGGESNGAGRQLLQPCGGLRLPERCQYGGGRSGRSGSTVRHVRPLGSRAGKKTLHNPHRSAPTSTVATYPAIASHVTGVHVQNIVPNYHHHHRLYNSGRVLASIFLGFVTMIIFTV
jgi:hypothetical protein